jgi:endonuclease YncB( thermonuclease family)
MSKHWNPGRKPVALGKSRIRRDPVPVAKPKVRTYSPELEMWGGVAGVLLFSAAIAVVIVGIGIATFSRYDPAAAAAAAKFGQCYNGGPNCVVDGETIHVARRTVAIAGIAAPRIEGAKCEGERDRGIEAAVQLADLLNAGEVTVSGQVRSRDGRDVRKVAVDGEDVGAQMIAAGLARRADRAGESWCGD